MKEVKLIASDMDHTLLTEKGELPPNFDKYINKLNNLGIDFAIASGRPLYTLTNIFNHLKDEMVFISDNGGAISYKGELIFKSLIDVSKYQEMIRFVEEKTDGMAILCGLDSAYISKKHQGCEDIFRIFYSNITFVDDLKEVVCDANKFTIYFPNEDAKENYENIFKPEFEKDFAVTIGDTVWIDIMNKGVSKGEAMLFIGKRLNIDSTKMMAFGDTYNDIEMLKTVKYSYIVANANEDMKQYASYTTKSNDEYGVIKVLDELIELKS